jgi:small-conductance mechanosensitive channel
VLGFSFTVAGARAAAAGIRTWARRAAGAVPSTSLLQNVARLLVYVLGVFLILQNLGVKVGALVASLGIGGLAVALALQDTLSNLFAGFQIILARQVRNGDYVQLDTGQEGFVTDIKWRNTTIKSRVEDHEVVVPNAKLANAIVTNYSLPREAFWVRLEVGVSYDSDLERVEEVTLEVARDVLEEFGESGGDNEPVFRYQGFGDSAITFRLRIRVNEFTKQFPVRHEMVKRIHARYREEGIEIPFPIRTLFAPEGFDMRGDGAPASRPPEELREVAGEE